MLTIVPCIAHFGNEFSSDHYCNQNENDSLCVLLKDLKNPDFSRGSSAIDLVVVPHRGYWGFDSGDGPGSGPPQNSAASIAAASDAGYRYVEMDIMRTRDDKTVSSHDYPIYRLTNSNQLDQYVFSKEQSELEDLLLIRRNGWLSNSHMLTHESMLDALATSKLIAFIDPKERIGNFVNGICVAFCDNESFKKVNWLVTVSRFLGNLSTRSLRQIAIKVPPWMTPKEIRNGVTQRDDTGRSQTAEGLGLSRMSEVLWVPELISKSYNNDISQIRAGIASWNNQTYGKALAYFETDFFNDTDIQVLPFYDDGTYYSNILEFIAVVAGLRSGIFSEEPVASRGVYTRWGVGKMKDLNQDLRGSLTWLLSKPYSGYLVVTTDVPNQWSEIASLD